MPIPTYATVINQINTFIVANGNNEITANILNPILKLLIDFSNNTIGDLSALITNDNYNIVSALNSLKNDINGISNDGVKLFTGFDDPNLVPPFSFNYADFYMQLSVIDNSPVDLYQWNGSEWTSAAQSIAAILDTQTYKTITTDTTIDDTFHHTIVLIKANATLTLNAGLRADLNFTTRTFDGFTATYVSGSGATISSESDGLIQSPKKTASILKDGADNYIITGTNNFLIL